MSLLVELQQSIVTGLQRYGSNRIRVCYSPSVELFTLFYPSGGRHHTDAKQAEALLREEGYTNARQIILDAEREGVQNHFAIEFVGGDRPYKITTGGRTRSYTEAGAIRKLVKTGTDREVAVHVVATTELCARIDVLCHIN